MSRSAWKGLFLANFLLRKKNKVNIEKIKKKYIWARNSVISAKFLKKVVYIHTGKEFKKIFITKDKIGFKFGAFVFTRKVHKKNKISKKTIKQKKKKN